MCRTCEPVKTYETIDSAKKLNSIKAHAYSLVEEGAFTVLKDLSDRGSDYCEVQFHCEECGKNHVLWLHTFMCRTGGEWRVLD